MQEITLFSKSIDSIEHYFYETFNYSNMNINTFGSQCFGVVNLSNYEYSFVEQSVLGKGLKFCPTPPMYDHGILKESVVKFFKSASLKLFFKKK